MIYNVEKLGTINIGRHGENLARVIEIDVSSMLKQWPDATITLLVKRNKDEAPYVAATELVDGVLYWPVTRAETAVPGNGLIEIRATCGETIAKSVTGFIRVSSALTGNETEPPETAKSWVDQVIEYGNEATQAAIKAKEEADRLSGINAKAVTLPEGSEAAVTVEDGRLVYGIPKGDKGDPGNDGYTPVKGVDYFDGEPGKDGTDATVTKDSIKTALGYTPADDADMAGKLTEPSTGLEVGKYFRIAAIDENGHAVLEAVDAPVGGLPTEPSLWPAWTSYEQAAARERMGFPGEWELIERVTITEKINDFYRDTEPDGSPYRFAAMIVRADFADVASGTNYGSSVYSVRFGDYKSYDYFTTRTISRNQSLFAYIDCTGKCINSNAFIANNYGASLATNRTGTMNTVGLYALCQAFEIGNFTIGSLFPAGVVFTIWGVRM